MHSFALLTLATSVIAVPVAPFIRGSVQQHRPAAERNYDGDSDGRYYHERRQASLVDAIVPIVAGVKGHTNVCLHFNARPHVLLILDQVIAPVSAAAANVGLNYDNIADNSLNGNNVNVLRSVLDAVAPVDAGIRGPTNVCSYFTPPASFTYP